MDQMIMQYIITNADEMRGQITVKFTRNGDTLGLMALDVPIVDGKFITGDVLKNHILTYAPTHIVQRQDSIKAASNFEEIKSLVVSENYPPSTCQVARATPWQQMTNGAMDETLLRAFIQNVIDEDKVSGV